MARRKRKSEFERTVGALARLPFQACLILAVLAYAGFRQLAQIQPPPAQNIEQMGNSVVVTLFKTAGMYLQFIAPLTLVLAAWLSWLGKRRRTRLLEETEVRTHSAPLQQLSWREFEQFVGAHFERLGYGVRFTPDGADGGVDLIAQKGGEIFLVQCKQWRATQIGVKVVRELFGVMAARGATGAYVVSIGAFSRDATAFAAGRNIELLDANTLLPSTQAPRPAPTRPQTATNTPQSSVAACPKCGATMVRRIAKQGVNKGQPFYGCSTYPKCHGTLRAD